MATPRKGVGPCPYKGHGWGVESRRLWVQSASQVRFSADKRTSSSGHATSEKCHVWTAPNRLLDCVGGTGQFIDHASTDAEEFDVTHIGPSPSALATLRKRSRAVSRLSTISAATSSGGGSRSGSSIA